jgi:transposase
VTGRLPPQRRWLGGDSAIDSWQDPFGGTVFVFCSKRADRVKLLVHDGTGPALIWTRLEGVRFKWPTVSDGVMRLSVVQPAALFDRLDCWRMRADCSAEAGGLSPPVQSRTYDRLIRAAHDGRQAAESIRP